MRKVDRFSVLAAMFFAFNLGYSVRSDWTNVFGADYAFAAWLYFVVGHLLATAMFLISALRGSASITEKN